MYPQVFVSVGKDRRRSYNGNYYLKDGEEFELELFNPSTDVFTCEIHLNGKPISKSTLILKPGERVYLDRYLDEAKKFKFETYEVENTSEAKSAIRLNGQVKVKFYKEKKVEVPVRIDWNPLPYWKDELYDSHKITWNTKRESVLRSFDNYDSLLYSYEASQSVPDSCSIQSQSIETGMVGKGNNSNQQLVENNSFNFESYSSYETTFYIYPETNTPISISEMVQYCSSCGKKRKKGENYCSHCGNKF